MVKKLKSATVFISTHSGTGSGFLFKKDNKTGYIATNAHVVGDANTVKITFNSGETGEFSIDGAVIACDPKRDLAIVKINSSKLPVPLTIFTDEKKLKKEMPLYALGFPLGKFFSDAPGKNPSVTITQGILNDLLRNDNGVLSDIQFNADINFGNSGGPVVNRDGQVIAVAYEGKVGTQIERGIPAPRLYKFIQGNIKDFSIKKKENKHNTILVDVAAYINDPFNNIDALKILIIPKNKITGELIKLVPGTGYYEPAIKDHNSYTTLKRDNKKFKLELSLKIPDGEDIIYCYQLMIIKKDKQIVFTEPKELYIMSVSAKGSKASSTSYSAIQKTFISAGMKIHQFILKLQNSESMALGRNGKYLFLLRDGVIHKVSISSLTVNKVYSTTYHCRNIAISEYGLLVAVWDRLKKKKGIMILNEYDLSLRAWIPVSTQQPLHIIASPRMRYAYAIEHYGHEMFIVDSKLEKIEEKINSQKDFKIDNFSTVAISPDGKYFYCAASKTLHKFKIYGPKLILISKGPSVLPKGGNIVISPDGKYIAFCSSRAIIYQTDDLSKKLITLPVEAPHWIAGFAFDTRRKRFYYGNRIYTSNGVFVKKIPGGQAFISILVNSKLFLRCSSSLICVDLDYKPEQLKKIKNNDSNDDDGWLGNEEKENVTEQKKDTAIKSLVKAERKVEDIAITEIDLNVNNILGRICWTHDRKSFLVAEKNGIVRKISFPGLVEEYKIDLKSKIQELQLCKSGAVVLAPKEQLIYLLNEKDLSIIKKIPAPGIWKFSASPGLDIIYGNNGNDRSLHFIDITRGGIVKSLKCYKDQGKAGNRVGLPKFLNLENCYASIEGKYLLCKINYPKKLVRFKILNKGLDLEYEDEIEIPSDNSFNLNFSMESGLLKKHFLGNAIQSIEACKLENLSTPIVTVDALLLGVDRCMQKFYGFDREMNLKVFDAQGKVIKTYPTNMRLFYNILVHPDGAKFIVRTREKIFKVELPAVPSPIAFTSVKKSVQEEINVLERTIRMGNIPVAFYTAPGSLLMAEDHKSFYAAINGIIRRVSFDGTVLAIGETDKDPYAHAELMLTKAGLVWMNNKKTYVFDKNSLKLKKKFEKTDKKYLHYFYNKYGQCRLIAGGYYIAAQDQQGGGKKVYFFKSFGSKSPDFELSLDIRRGIISVNKEKQTLLLRSCSEDGKKGNILKVDFKGRVIKEYPLPGYLVSPFNNIVKYRNYLLTSCKIRNFRSPESLYTAVINLDPDNNELHIPVKEVMPLKTEKTEKVTAGEPQIKDDTEITKLTFPFKLKNARLCWGKDYKHFFILNDNQVLKKISFPNFQVVCSIDFKEYADSLQQSAQGLTVVLPKFNQLAILDEKDLSVKSKIFVPGIERIICSHNSDIAFSCGKTRCAVLTAIDLKNRKINETVDLDKIIKEHKLMPNSTPHAVIAPDGKYLFYSAAHHILKFKLTAGKLVLEETSSKIEGGSRISIRSNRTLTYGIFKTGTYLFHTNNLKRSEQRLLPIHLITAVDEKLGVIYGRGEIYDINSGMIILDTQKHDKIYPVPGKKEFLSSDYSGIAYTRWGLSKNPFSSPEVANRKIFGKTVTEKGITVTNLDIKKPDDLLNKCLWEPGTNNIFIAWRNGKIAKIDIEKGIELCTVNSPDRYMANTIDDVALSKHNILLKRYNRIYLFSPKDLSAAGTIPLCCERVVAHPELDVAFLLAKEFLMTYDLNRKKVVDITWCGGVPYKKFLTLSPDGKTLYADTGAKIKTYSIVNRRLKFLEEIDCGQIYKTAERLKISDDNECCVGLPQYHQAAHKRLSLSKYATYICKTNDLNKAVSYIDTGTMIHAMGIDNKNKLVYTHVRRKNGDKLLIKNGKKMHEYDLLGNNRFFSGIYVHPQGGEFIILAGGLFLVKLDLSDKDLINAKGK
jgi:WD40 repeat protein